MATPDTLTNNPAAALPGLDCGICGYRKCADLAEKALSSPDIFKRCIHLTTNPHFNRSAGNQQAPSIHIHTADSCSTCGPSGAVCATQAASITKPFMDALGRDFDFYLEHFPEDPGPREIIIPHNPMITRELDIKEGDIMIGRPLGMSCGCPITHCGIAVEVDKRTSVMTWCVTGPLNPREKGFKDLGYYIAEGYEGLIHESRSELSIGRRYFFQPRMCMLQWRHSGLINYLNRVGNSIQVRVEGLWIG